MSNYDVISSESVLTNKNFALYFLGAGFSLHGTWIQRIAQGWLAWDLTGSEAWVGAVSFLDFFPVAILAPAFGVVADRVDRKRMMIWANALMMLNIATLTLFTILGKMDIYLLVTFVLIQGTLTAIHTPARLALVPNLVDKKDLSRALAHMALMFNVSRFIGPALAGLIIAAWDVTGAFAVNTISFLIFAIALSLLHVHSERTHIKRKKPFKEFKEGFLYALQRPSIIWSFFMLVAVGFFARGALELMPAFADVFFQRGSSGLAALTSAAGAGAIVGALKLASDKPIQSLFAWVVGAGLASSLVLVFFAINSNFWMGLVLMACLGFTVTLVGVGIQIIIQARVDDDYRGRVMSIWASIGFGAVAVGGLSIGSLASPLGLARATLTAGVLCGVLVLIGSKPFLNRASTMHTETDVAHPLQ